MLEYSTPGLAQVDCALDEVSMALNSISASIRPGVRQWSRLALDTLVEIVKRVGDPH